MMIKPFPRFTFIVPSSQSLAEILTPFSIVLTLLFRLIHPSH